MRSTGVLIFIIKYKSIVYIINIFIPTKLHHYYLNLIILYTLKYYLVFLILIFRYFIVITMNRLYCHIYSTHLKLITINCLYLLYLNQFEIIMKKKEIQIELENEVIIMVKKKKFFIINFDLI